MAHRRRDCFLVGTTVVVAAYFKRPIFAIKMTEEHNRPGKTKVIEYEPIALLAGGCVVFVLCWFFY